MSREGIKGLLLAIAGAVLLPVTVATASMAWIARERVAVVEARSTVLESTNAEAHQRIEAKMDKQDEKLDRLLERVKP